MNDEEFEAIAVQHGGLDNVKKIHTAAGVVVVRGPTESEYQVLKQILKKDELAASAKIARMFAVHPAKDELNAWIARKPGIVEPCANAAAELAGVLEVEAQKK